MQHYGLIGYPLSHSFSPVYFGAKFEKEQITADYSTYPLSDINEFSDLLNKFNGCLKGLNVTIPYKQAIIPHLDQLSPAAQEIGAVNTIQFKNNQLIGHNTDVYGFEKSLLPLLKDHHQKALILGTGGASKAIIYVCNQLQIHYQLVSRIPKENVITYSDLTAEIIQDHSLIINTTPLGMHPNLDSSPAIPYKHLNDQHLLYDLVYNPSITQFMQKGIDQNAVVKNGLEMLHLQAEKAWQIWNE